MDPASPPRRPGFVLAWIVLVSLAMVGMVRLLFPSPESADSPRRGVLLAAERPRKTPTAAPPAATTEPGQALSTSLLPRPETRLTSAPSPRQVAPTGELPFPGVRGVFEDRHPAFHSSWNPAGRLGSMGASTLILDLPLVPGELRHPAAARLQVLRNRDGLYWLRLLLLQAALTDPAVREALAAVLPDPIQERLFATGSDPASDSGDSGTSGEDRPGSDGPSGPALGMAQLRRLKDRAQAYLAPLSKAEAQRLQRRVLQQLTRPSD